MGKTIVKFVFVVLSLSFAVACGGDGGIADALCNAGCARGDQLDCDIGLNCVSECVEEIAADVPACEVDEAGLAICIADIGRITSCFDILNYNVPSSCNERDVCISQGEGGEG